MEVKTWAHDIFSPIIIQQALFEVGTVVLALYPQTTCFYRGKIDGLPAHPTDDYSVLFEDVTYENGYSSAIRVAQKYVVVSREMRDKK